MLLPVYISSLFSEQGLPEVNEFLLIHRKSQCLHIVYTIITAIPTWNFRFLKSGIRWTLPNADTSTDTPCPEVVECLVTTVSVT